MRKKTSKDIYACEIVAHHYPRHRQPRCVKETKKSSRGGGLTSRELKHRCDVKNNRLTFSQEFKVLQRHKDINMYGASGGLFYMHYMTASLFSLLRRRSWFLPVCSRQTHTSVLSKRTQRVSGGGGVGAAPQGFPARGKCSSVLAATLK